MGEKIEITSNSYLSLSATSVQELTTALARCSNTAQEAGVDFDTLAGYAGIISSTTRKSAETVGESLKTIMVRFQDIKLTSMMGGGFLDDGDSASNVEKTMEKIGIAFKNAEGEFRSFTDIIDELSEKWNTLDEESQRAVSKALGGTHQRENFMVLLNNLSKAKELTAQALQDEGIAEERYGIYMESTTAKINQLKDSFQELATSIMNSGLINQFVDGTRNVVDFINSIGGLPPLLTTIGGLMLTISSKSMGINVLTNGISKLIIGLTTLKTLNIKTIFSSIFSGFTNLKNGFSIAAQSVSAYSKGIISAKSLSAGLVPVISSLASVVGVLTIAFGAMYAMHQKHKQQLEELSQKQLEEAHQYSDDAKALDELKEKYTEITNSTDDVKTKKEQLKSLQEELVSTYGSEADGIDLVNGKYSDQIDILNGLNEERAKQAKIAYKEQVDDLTKDINKELSNNSFGIDLFNYGGKNDVDKLKDIVSKIENVDIARDGQGIKLKFDVDNAEEYKEALGNILNAMQNADKGGTTLFKNLKGVYDSLISSTDELSEAQKNWYDIEVRNRLDNVLKNTNIDSITNATTEQLDKLKESFANTKDEFGKLPDDGLKKYFNDYVDSLAKASQKTDEFANNASSNISDGSQQIMESISQVSDSLSDLNTLYTKSFDYDNNTFKLPFDVSDVEKLRDKFGDLGDTFDEFEKVLLNNKSTSQDVQNAFDNLSTACITQSGLLDNLNTSNRDLIVSQLELQGVQNASQIVTEELAIKSEELAKEGKKLSEITLDEALKFVEEANCSEQAKNALILFKLAKIDANSITLMTDNDINNLISLIDYLGGATRALQIYQRAKSEQQQGTKLGFLLLEHKDDVIQNAVDEIEQVKNNVGKYSGGASASFTPSNPKSSSGSKKSSGSGSKSKQYAKYIEKDLDNSIKIIEEKGQKLTDYIELLDSKIANATTNGNKELQDKLEKEKSSIIDRQLENTKQSIMQLMSLKKKWTSEIQKMNISELKGVDFNSITESTLSTINNKFEKEIYAAEKSQNDKAKANLEYNKSMVNEYFKAIIDADKKLNDLHKTNLEQQGKKIEQTISLLEKEYQLRKKVLDEKQQSLDMSKILMDEESEDYDKTYQVEYDIIVEKQGAIQDVVYDLLNSGLDKNSDTVQEKVDEYMSLEEDRLKLMKESYDREMEMQKQTLEKELDERKEALEKEKDMLENTKDTLNKALDDIKEKQSALNDIISETVTLIRHECEEKKEAIQREIDGYKKIIDEKKQILELDKENKTHKEELDEKNTNISNLQSQLTLAKLDNSDAGKKKVKELEDQLKKANKELEDYNYDYALEKTLDRLDKEYEMFEEEKNKEIKEIDEYLEQGGTLIKDAMDRIQRDGDKLYQELIRYNTIYGDYVGTELTKKWNLAQEAIKEFGGEQGNVLNTMYEMGNQVDNITSKIENLTLQIEQLNTEMSNLSKVKEDIDKINSTFTPQDVVDKNGITGDTLSNSIDLNKKDTSQNNSVTNNTQTQYQQNTTQTKQYTDQEKQQRYLHQLMLKAKQENNKG